MGPQANGSDSPNTLRSIGAVFVGVLANFLIAVPIDVVLHVMGVYPSGGEPLSDGLCALASSYRILAALVGGYLAARLAPRRPLKHALILGCVGIVLSSAGAAATWGMGPPWYPLLLIAISIPCSFYGGKLYTQKAT